MKFEPPLIPATLIRRYKRFLADVRLETGQELTAHIANPGAMTGFKDEGLRVWLQPATNPARKLKYSWILAQTGDGHFTGLDTSLPNKIVGKALHAGQIPSLAQYKTITPEQKYGQNSRIDFLLTQNGHPDTYVEVKSVTLSRQTGLAEFPDSVTARGAKHLEELSEMVRTGKRAVMLYLIQRSDCDRFALAADIDPNYAQAFGQARAAGVEILAYRTNISTTQITVAEPVELFL